MISSIGVPKSIDLTKSASDLYPSCNTSGVNCYYLLIKHLVRVGLGVVAFFFATKIDHRICKKYAVFGFTAMVLALFMVLILGSSFNTTATSWIVVFDSSFQPTEIAKLFMILYFAKCTYLTSHKDYLGRKPRNLLLNLMMLRVQKFSVRRQKW